MPIKAIIIDDERLARKELKSLLKVVIKVLVKKLLFIFEEFIMLIWSLTTSLIHKPFLFITAR